MNENYKRIHEKADELTKRNGKRPTLAELRTALGGGSFTTISEAMKLWRQSEEQQAQSELISIPEALQDSFSTVWKQAQQLANDQLTVEREALKKSQLDSERAQAELAEVVQQLENELLEIKSLFERSEKEVFDLRLQLERGKVQIDRLVKVEEELVRAQQSEREAIKEAAELRGELKAKK